MSYEADAVLSRNGSWKSWVMASALDNPLHGVLSIARLTWLEARRTRIALAALVCAALFLTVYGLAVLFLFPAGAHASADARGTYERYSRTRSRVFRRRHRALQEGEDRLSDMRANRF